MRKEILFEKVTLVKGLMRQTTFFHFHAGINDVENVEPIPGLLSKMTKKVKIGEKFSFDAHR